MPSGARRAGLKGAAVFQFSIGDAVFTDGLHRLEVYKVSILYWRCARRGDRVPLAGEARFNSLLEMPLYAGQATPRVL